MRGMNAAPFGAFSEIVRGMGLGQEFITDPMTGQQMDISEFTDDILWDRTSHGASITAGTEFDYFANPNDSSKTDRDTNLTQARSLPSGHQFLVWRVGVELEAGTSASDAALIWNNAVVTFRKGNRTQREGPLNAFQSGVGIAGNTTANDTSILTNGAAGQRMQQPLQIPIFLSDETEFDVTIQYPSQTTLGSARNVQVTLYGWRRRPIK